MGQETIALAKYMTPELQERASGILTSLRNAAHANSADKGFWEKDDEILKLLQDACRPDLAKHHWNNVMLTKIALIHSELGEMTEGIRTGNGPSDKLHEYGLSQAEEEGADVFVRLGDLFGRMGWNLGASVLKKMGYNTGRERLHGKQL